MTRKRTQPSRHQKSRPPAAPFALVLYEEGLTMGVVSCRSIEGDVRKGAQCMAPNPIDWPDNLENERFSAKIVELGHDIDYLYTIQVSLKGKILKNPPSAEILAKKRDLKEHQVQSRRRREANQAELDNRIQNLTPLFAETHQGFNQPGTSLSGSDMAESLPEEPSNLYQSSATSLPSHTEADNPTSTTAILEREGNNLDQSKIPSITNDGTSTNTILQKASESSNCCHLSQILSEASPSQNALLLGVFETTSTSNVSPSDKAFLMRVSEAIKSHMTDKNMTEINNLKDMSKAPSTISIGNLDSLNDISEAPSRGDLDCLNDMSDAPTPSTSTTINIGDFDCLKEGPNKFRFLADFDIFLEKNVIFGIPPVISKIQTETSPLSSSSPKKRRKKPKGKENGMYPRQLVTHLLKLLVPKHLMTNKKAKDFPDCILKAIKAYLNYRLPEEERLTDQMINTYVNDYTRGLNRKRAEENERKKLKQDESQETIMLDWNVDEMPIILLEEN